MSGLNKAAAEDKGYKWNRIEPLSDKDRKSDLAGISSLYSSWREARTRMERGRMSLSEFNERLIRRLSIETGILEKLYDLDRGTTESLVSQGFAENLVPRNSTNIEPSSLIDILKDQQAAIKHAMNYVSSKRPLTKSFIHELHSMLLQHQDTTTVVDTLGQKSERALVKGKYKEHPNNPRRENGELHEYCPPIHVESEMDNLLGWFSEYADEDPIISAAWLHHRFTQIHPYQDGNGRLARVLTTMVLVRQDLLPVVIEREDRSRYIDALEKADAGDIAPFATMLARLEKDAIVRALSVEEDDEPSLTTKVISNIGDRLNRRQERKSSDLRKVNDAAIHLQRKTDQELRGYLDKLQEELRPLGRAKVWVDSVKPGDKNSHWYRSDVIESAKAVNKFVNLSEEHYFTKGALQINDERFVFVVSFHHVGRELSGIMEATAFFRLETNQDDSPPPEFHICSKAPIGSFVFTHETKFEDVESAFSSWLDEVFSPAVKQFGERL